MAGWSATYMCMDKEKYSSIKSEQGAHVTTHRLIKIKCHILLKFNWQPMSLGDDTLHNGNISANNRKSVLFPESGIGEIYVIV